MRFWKLLLVAWGALLITMPTIGGVFGALGGALLVAAVTWFIIRRHPADEFELNSKPTYGMLLAIGLIGVGGRYGPLSDAGRAPGDALLASHLSLSGLLMLVGIIGFVRARSYPSELI